MNPDNRKKLESRVASAAWTALQKQSYVSPIDVPCGMGWLDPSHLQRWRRGQLACLEHGVQANLSRVSEAMRLFRVWARNQGLNPSETVYLARIPGRPTLRFSKSGDATIEKLYRTHWVSPELSSKKREALTKKTSAPPELIVIQPLETDWKCHSCGATGNLLIMEPPGPSCLACAGLGSLVFLPAGDAALTRRAKAGSELHALVMRFSRTRKRYERQGILVLPEALENAQQT